MTDLQDWSDPLSEVEALIRSARDYVHASDDLRPRVLETARAKCGERHARRRIRQVALTFVLWGLCATSSVEHANVALAQRSASQLRSSDDVLSRAEANAAVCGDYASGFVDAFVELRKQQADVLRLEL